MRNHIEDYINRKKIKSDKKICIEAFWSYFLKYLKNQYVILQPFVRYFLMNYFVNDSVMLNRVMDSYLETGFLFC